MHPRGRGKTEAEAQTYSGVLGAFGRDFLKNNGQRLLSFAGDHDLAILHNMFYSTCMGGASHTFTGKGKTRIDYILPRQSNRQIVGNVTMHKQPEGILRSDDHNIVSARLRLTSHFMPDHNKRGQ